MGWAFATTVMAIVMVLGAALAVAVYDHRYAHPVPSRVPPAARVSAFPWSRALHHEALIMALIMAGVLLLDRLVSTCAVPALLNLGGWPMPPTERSMSLWLQGWALILGIQAVQAHALRLSFREWRHAHGAMEAWQVVRDAVLLVTMAAVGAWMG